MDPFLLPALLGGAVVGGYVIYDRWRTRYWYRIATDCGLQEVRIHGLAWGLKLHARSGPLKVRIAGSRHNKGGTQVVIVIPEPAELSQVSIYREYQAPWKTHEIEVGSEPFDQKFCVQGSERIALALLNAETRDLLILLNDVLTTVGSRLEISGGELLVDTVDRELSRILPLVLRVGEWLAQPMDIKGRLAQNATRDPIAGVRVQNLLLLARELPGDEKTLEVLRTARHDPSPWVRLWAGKALGIEGRGILLSLAENLEDDAVSAQAVSFLESELTFEGTKAILLHALSRRRPKTAIACLEALGRAGDAPAVSLLVEVMEQQQGEIAVVAAHALGTTGSPAAEEPLIQALFRAQADPRSDLRVAAAKALGRVGSTAAVLPLKKALGLWEPELMNQVIAEIQSRLPGASPGQLSLAGAEAGQLSLAQAEAGQLSIAADPAGQLSLDDTEDKPEKA